MPSLPLFDINIFVRHFRDLRPIDLLERIQYEMDIGHLLERHFYTSPQTFPSIFLRLALLLIVCCVIETFTFFFYFRNGVTTNGNTIEPFKGYSYWIELLGICLFIFFFCSAFSKAVDLLIEHVWRFCISFILRISSDDNIAFRTFHIRYTYMCCVSGHLLQLMVWYHRISWCNHHRIFLSDEEEKCHILPGQFLLRHR